VEIEAGKIQALGEYCTCLVAVAEAEDLALRVPRAAGAPPGKPKKAGQRSLFYDELPSSALRGRSPWLEGRLPGGRLVVGTLNFIVDHPDRPMHTPPAYVSPQVVEKHLQEEEQRGREGDGLGLVSMHEGLRKSYLFNVCVARAYRRFGIGTQLLGKAHDLSRDEGALHSYMHCDDDNHAAISMYKGLGYLEVEQRSRKWWYIAGSAQRLLLEHPL